MKCSQKMKLMIACAQPNATNTAHSKWQAPISTPATKPDFVGLIVIMDPAGDSAGWPRAHKTFCPEFQCVSATSRRIRTLQFRVYNDHAALCLALAWISAPLVR